MCQSIYNIINLPFITSLGWYFDRDDFLLFREHLKNERHIVYVKSNSTKKGIEVITIHLQTMFVFYFVLTINLLNIVKLLLFGNVFVWNSKIIMSRKRSLGDILCLLRFLLIFLLLLFFLSSAKSLSNTFIGDALIKLYETL